MRTVLTLAELQWCFLDALYAPDAGDPSAWIESGGLTSSARLAIYRHSGEEIHAAALRTAYPAVRALVGDAYFDRVARQYRLAHPSRSGNLQTFGDAFGTFLETLPETAGLRYLGDVARLEWHRQQAALAADAAPLSGDAFASLLATVEGPIRIGLHPSLRMFVSAHPVLTIWQFAMQPPDARVTLPERGDHTLIWRDGGQVAMSLVHTASFACIEAMLQGLCVEAADRAARALDPEFDLPACVTGLLQNGLVTTIEMFSTPTMERSTWPGS